ncbi:MAG: hypothetical protein AAF846_27410 [Chloroflexota bacterium]
MLISRKPFTDWEFKINLLSDSEPNLSATKQQAGQAFLETFYRTTWDGREFELFSMTAKNCDDLFLQIRIYTADDIRIFQWLPHLIEQKEMVFYITPLYEIMKTSGTSAYPYQVLLLPSFLPNIPIVT